MTIYAIVLTSVLLVTIGAALFWRSERDEAHQDARDLLGMNGQLQKELDFLKITIMEFNKKPIVIKMTQEQIEHIGIVVAKRVKEPEPWQN